MANKKKNDSDWLWLLLLLLLGLLKWALPFGVIPAPKKKTDQTEPPENNPNPQPDIIPKPNVTPNVTPDITPNVSPVNIPIPEPVLVPEPEPVLTPEPVPIDLPNPMPVEVPPDVGTPAPSPFYVLPEPSPTPQPHFDIKPSPILFNPVIDVIQHPSGSATPELMAAADAYVASHAIAETALPVVIGVGSLVVVGAAAIAPVIAPVVAPTIFELLQHAQPYNPILAQLKAAGLPI